MTTSLVFGRGGVRRTAGAMAAMGLAAAGVFVDQSPAAAADDVLTVTIYVAGDPTSTVAYGVGTLGDAPSARMSYYSTDGDLNQFSPGVTPSSGPGSTCVSDYVVDDSSPSDGVFVYQLTCNQPIISYHVGISVGAGSCLHTQTRYFAH